jgi:hypothetical protein
MPQSFSKIYSPQPSPVQRPLIFEKLFHYVFWMDTLTRISSNFLKIGLCLIEVDFIAERGILEYMCTHIIEEQIFHYLVLLHDKFLGPKDR